MRRLYKTFSFCGLNFLWQIWLFTLHRWPFGPYPTQSQFHRFSSLSVIIYFFPVESSKTFSSNHYFRASVICTLTNWKEHHSPLKHFNKKCTKRGRLAGCELRDRFHFTLLLYRLIFTSRYRNTPVFDSRGPIRFFTEFHNPCLEHLERLERTAVCLTTFMLLFAVNCGRAHHYISFLSYNAIAP